MIGSLVEKIKLLDGNEIPGYGFGCYNAFGKEISDAVRMALEAGYRYIDSATFYKNEDAVGQGIQDAAIAREELFILSKTWPHAFYQTEKSVMDNLKNLRVEYLDCMLLHWPGVDEAARLHAYETGMRLREKGVIRSLGVSNFQMEQIDRLNEEFGEWPVINELELHPAYQQKALVAYCQERGIQPIAYSPIARGAYVEQEDLVRIGNKYQKTSTQVVLRWHTQKGHIPIPKSSHENRIRENADIFDFVLNEEEMALVDRMDAGKRLGRDPYTFPPAELV